MSTTPSTRTLTSGLSGSPPGTFTPSAAASPRVAWRIDRNFVPCEQAGEDALPDQDVGEARAATLET